MLSLAILFAIYCLTLLAITLLFLWYILRDLFNRIIKHTLHSRDYPSRSAWGS